MSSAPKRESQEDFGRLTERRFKTYFDLWRRVVGTIEEAIATGGRDLTEPYSRALHLLFLQAYKSVVSAGLLSRYGLCEDSALIVRRLLEIAWQADYIGANTKPDRDARAQSFLAYCRAYLHYSGASDDSEWIREQFEQCKHLLEFKGSGRPIDWWGQGGIASLARRLDRMDTYTTDYSWLSQVAHANAAGVLPGTFEREKIQILATDLAPTLVVFAVGYALIPLMRWNEHFEMIEFRVLESFSREVGELKNQLPRGHKNSQ